MPTCCASYDSSTLGWKHAWWITSASWDQVHQILEDEEQWQSVLGLWDQGTLWHLNRHTQICIHTIKKSEPDCVTFRPQLKFMWGNLAVGSGERWREVAVPTLQPGQVGVISVALCAPTLEGTYTSHWRLAHRGEQFGPRVWCSIVVDPHAPTAICADGLLVSPCVTPQVRERSRDSLNQPRNLLYMCRCSTVHRIIKNGHISVIIIRRN